MKHKPYEEWIFSDDELTHEERRALKIHLTTCDRCRRLDRNWRSVRGTFASAPAVGPAPGFSARWARKLEQENRRRQARRSIVQLGVTFAGAALFISAIGVRFLGELEGSIRTAIDHAHEIAAWTATVGTSLSGVPPLSETAPILLAPLAVMIFCTAIGAGGIAWLKMFRLLARLQGFTQWA